MIQTEEQRETKKWNKIWNIIGISFTTITIIGGLGLVYFEKIERIMGNPVGKTFIYIYGAIATFCMVYSEVRTRTEGSSLKKVLSTILVIAIVFTIFAITRL